MPKDPKEKIITEEQAQEMCLDLPPMLERKRTLTHKYERTKNAAIKEDIQRIDLKLQKRYDALTKYYKAIGFR